MENLPAYIAIVFGLTTILTVGLFYKAAHHSKTTLLLLLTWLALQALVARLDFYTVTSTLPPRFLLVILPPLMVIISLFATTKGRQYLNNLDQKSLTILHIVRIPIELVLFWLFIHKTVPQLMTFEGRNLDILSGLTAPVIFYFAYIRKQLDRKLLLIWNFICLGLLINIILNGILSAPTPFQQFAFDQPNIAVLHYPFVWLPGCIVPLVLLSHLATIRQLLSDGRRKQRVSL